MNITYGQVRQVARKLAQETLDAYWDANTFPVDPVIIARKAGIEVYVAQLGKDVWGSLIGGSNSATMYLDVDQPPTRKRFSAAHELGHYMTHSADSAYFKDLPIKPIPVGKGYVDKRSVSGKGNLFEVLANEFAGSLLMPEQEVQKCIEAGMSSMDLAVYFGVSVDAITYRRKILNI